jgi:predicted PurR-regulated permease PerM
MTLSFSNAFLMFLRDAFMVAIFLAFFLFEVVFFRHKLDRAFEGSRAEQIKKIISDVMTQVTRYLSIKFIISVANGVLIGLGLWIIGLEFAIIWGLIQSIVNFIPTVGTIAVGLAATAFGVIQFWPAPAPMIAVGLVMFIVNIILGNIVDPNIMGDKLGLSPFVIIVSLLIWGWIWGFVGLILAVPMMVVIKIVCENIPVLEPISIMLGSGKAAMAARNEDNEKEKT